MATLQLSRSRLGDAARREWARRLDAELQCNILPFWINHAIDVKGGFHGAVTNDLRIEEDVPRTSVLCARILWTYSRAYRMFHKAEYLDMARHAYEALTRQFWDDRHGGVFWSIGSDGRPISDRKHTYAQAFAIYGLAEFFGATLLPESLRRAQELFRLMEMHARDRWNRGYLEGCSRAWEPMTGDMRLSEKEPHCRKSGNTLLHLLEAYTNLLRVWVATEPARALRDQIQVFRECVVDPRTGHMGLFFDGHWRSLSSRISFGHDIEASWLLVDAAEVLGDSDLRAPVTATALRMARAAYGEGVASEGSLRAAPNDEASDRELWVQAEAVLGFYNAFQLSADDRFAEAALRIFDLAERHFVDREHGDWFKRLSARGVSSAADHKVGPWECPYHHARCCLEMLARLDALI